MPEAEAGRAIVGGLARTILEESRGPARGLINGVTKVAKTRGRKIPLSLARKMIGDFLAVSQRIPLAHGERRIDIRALHAAVAALPRPRPDWLPLFFKAYAIVAADRPALRRLFVRRPWPYLYEHPENVGSVVISRRLEGDDALLYLPIAAPETLPLREIERLLKEAREKPIAEIPAFRRQVRLGRLPGFCRRAVLRLGIDWRHGGAPASLAHSA